MSEGEVAEETEREPEKLGLRGGRRAGPLRMGDSGCWRGRRGGMARLEGPRRLRSQECIGAFSVQEAFQAFSGFRLGLGLPSMHTVPTQVASQFTPLRIQPPAAGPSVRD